MTGMVVMSLIVGMVFYLFTAANKQLFDYTKSRNELNQFLTFEHQLKWDFNRANEVVRTPTGFKIQLNEESINYYLIDNLIIRNQKHSNDTLSTDLHEIEFQFVQQKERNTEVIDGVLIKTGILDKEMEFQLNSSVDPAQKINTTLLHAN